MAEKTGIYWRTLTVTITDNLQSESRGPRDFRGVCNLWYLRRKRRKNWHLREKLSFTDIETFIDESQTTSGLAWCL